MIVSLTVIVPVANGVIGVERSYCEALAVNASTPEYSHTYSHEAGCGHDDLDSEPPEALRSKPQRNQWCRVFMYSSDLGLLTRSLCVTIGETPGLIEIGVQA